MTCACEESRLFGVCAFLIGMAHTLRIMGVVLSGCRVTGGGGCIFHRWKSE